jgi:superfamily II RNA helicase
LFFFCGYPELLSQLVLAAASIGNDKLKVKFEEATKLVRRGIIFAGSLYLEA